MLTRREEIVPLVLKYEALLDARDVAYLQNALHGNWAECETADRELAAFLREYPSIMDYDDLGNYVGEMIFET